MKIKLTNNDEISAALGSVNGKACTHTINSAYDIRLVAARASMTLDNDGIPIRDRAGAQVTYTPGSPFKNNKYRMITTTITLQIGADGRTFYLVDAKREVIGNYAETFDIKLKALAVLGFVVRMGSKYGTLAAAA